MRALLPFLTLASFTVGCPAPAPSGNEQVENCTVDFPLEGQRTPATLEVGTIEGETFRPIASGGQIAKRTGGQGFAMITPAIRLPASISDEDELCLLVKLTHDALDLVGAQDFAPGNQVTVTFVRTGDGYLTDGVIYDVLGEQSLPGFHMNLGVTVVGADFEASVTLSNIVVGESA